jgi:hypothetical protein
MALRLPLLLPKVYEPRENASAETDKRVEGESPEQERNRKPDCPTDCPGVMRGVPRGAARSVDRGAYRPSPPDSPPKFTSKNLASLRVKHLRANESFEKKQMQSYPQSLVIIT